MGRTRVRSIVGVFALCVLVSSGCNSGVSPGDGETGESGDVGDGDGDGDGDTPCSFPSEVEALVDLDIDAEGNLYFAGLTGAGSWVAKLSGDCEEIWSTNLPGTISAIAADPDGNVAAAGAEDDDASVFSLDDAGELRWQDRQAGSSDPADEPAAARAHDVAFMPDGSIVVVGHVDAWGFDADRVLANAWVRTYAVDGSVDSDNRSLPTWDHDYNEGVDVSEAGSLRITGGRAVGTSPGNQDLFVGGTDSGTEWGSPDGLDRGLAVADDGTNRKVVAGYIWSEVEDRRLAFVGRFSSSVQPDWQDTFEGDAEASGTIRNEACDVVVSAAGDIIAVGSTTSDRGDAFVRVLDSDGNLVSHTPYQYEPGWNDAANAVAIHPDGRVIVVGSSRLDFESVPWMLIHRS